MGGHRRRYYVIGGGVTGTLFTWYVNSDEEIVPLPKELYIEDTDRMQIQHKLPENAKEFSTLESAKAFVDERSQEALETFGIKTLSIASAPSKEVVDLNRNPHRSR